MSTFIISLYVNNKKSSLFIFIQDVLRTCHKNKINKTIHKYAGFVMYKY